MADAIIQDAMTARSQLREIPSVDHPPRRRFTVAEVEAMTRGGIFAEDERLELIGGDLVVMSPKGNRHETVKSALLERWYRLTSERYTLTPETTFRLSSDTYLEPDVVIYERASGLMGLAGDNVLLVVEIADSSLRYDMGRKTLLYASFGVRELWVIDALNLRMRTFRMPSPDGYGVKEDRSADETAVPHFAPEAFALQLRTLDID